MRHWFAFVAACAAGSAMPSEPAAPLAAQPVLQAGEPMTVTVEYDVPALGPRDALAALEEGSRIEVELARAVPPAGRLRSARARTGGRR